MRLQLALALSCAAALSAQPPQAQPPQTLSLNLAQAETTAIQNNPQFSAAQFTASAAHQVPIEDRAALLPSANGSITGVGADSGSRLAAGALNNPAVYNRLASGLSVGQLLTDFGRTRSLVASADLRAQAQDQATETTRADILIATARAYFDLLRARAVLTVAQQTVAQRQVVSDQVTTLAQNLLRSTLDVSFANVNLADAQLLLVQAQNDEKSANADLATALGLPAQTTFTLAEEAMPGALPDQVDSLLQQALQDRPELKDLRLEQGAAERFVKAEHDLIYPTISAAGTAGVVPAGESVVPRRYGAIGVNVNIPILNGGLFRARQTEAELRARAAAQNVNDLVNRVIRDVRVAYLNAQTAFQRLGLTDQLLKTATESLDLAQSRYDLGLGSIVELSQAQLNLTSAQIASSSAKYDYQTQRVLVDFQIGALH